MGIYGAGCRLIGPPTHLCLRGASGPTFGPVWRFLPPAKLADILGRLRASEGRAGDLKSECNRDEVYWRKRGRTFAMLKRVLAGVVVAVLLAGGALAAITAGDNFLSFNYWVRDFPDGKI